MQSSLIKLCYQCRFAFVLDGAVNLTDGSGVLIKELHPDGFAFFPAGDVHRQALRAYMREQE